MGTPIPISQREASVSFDREIKTYKLTPEELDEVKRKYGSPGKKTAKEKIYSAAIIMDTLNQSNTVEEAAEKMCVNAHRLKVEMAKYNITVTEKKEDAKVYVPMDTAKERKKTYFEQALELLTREQYIDWKKEGLTDREIAEKAGFGYTSNTMTKLRKKWKLEGIAFTSKNYKTPAAPPVVSSEPEQAGPIMDMAEKVTKVIEPVSETAQAQPMNIEDELAALRSKITWLIEWSTIMHDRMRSAELALEGAACPLPQTMEEPQVRTIIDAYGQMMQIAYKLGAGEELTGEENDFYRDFCMMTRAATANDFYHLEHRINHHWHGSLSVHDSKAYFYERKNNLAR